ncbi:hypothetical protein KJ786_03320 [Patescibacteria group bacterium]|nr:hypothetical protein [Patescibacteria group bacterium]
MPIQTSKKVKMKETVEALWEAEKKFDFYNVSYNKIPLWSYLREKTYYLASGLASFSEPTSAFFKIRPINLFKRFIRFLFSLNKIFGNDIIIFANERHLQWNSQENNFYNQYVELALEDNPGKKPLIFEFPAFMKTKYKKTCYERYLPMDFIVAVKGVLSFLRLFFYPKINKEFYPKLKKSGLLQEKDIKKVVKFTALQAYGINYYGIFLKIIKLLNPKAKLIYGCMGALDKFPDVTEIQHGRIDDVAPQYVFPNISSIREYVKNKKIIVFSEEIRKILINNGYSSQNVKVKSNPKVYFYFLKNIQKNFFDKKAGLKEMVIIGGFGGTIQGTIKNFILGIEKNKEKFKDWNISLVLHPSEKNIYKDLELAKVKVFENHEVSLWEMLSRAVCLVSVTSSVIEEAIPFGCFEIIIKNKEMADQETMINLLCGDYPYRTTIECNDFPRWFESNENMLISHWQKKAEIMKKNYEYFQNFKKSIKIDKK